MGAVVHVLPRSDLLKFKFWSFSDYSKKNFFKYSVHKKKITKKLLNNINFIQSTTLGTFSIKQVG